MRTKGYLLLSLILVVLSVDCQPYRELAAYSPAAAYDAAYHRYITVYVKSLSAGDKLSRIYAQFVNDSGEPDGSEFIIFESASGFFHCPSIGYDGVNGRFLVVWQMSISSSGVDNTIYGQLMNADGTLNGPARVLSETADYSSCPAVAYDGDQGVYLALWYESLQQDSLQGRLIGADGSPAGSMFPVSLNVGGSGASVAYDSGSQRFMAAWDSADHLSIQGRIINPDGSFPASEFSLYSGGSDMFLPVLAYDDVNSRFLAAWEQSVGETYALVGEVLNADGSVFQPAFTISSAGLNIYGHALAYDPAGGTFLAVFADTIGDMIYGQVITAQGALDTTVSNGNILLSYQGYPGESEPTIAYDGASRRYLASWSYSPDNDSFYGDIHGRLVNSDATPSGSIFVLANGGAW